MGECGEYSETPKGVVAILSVMKKQKERESPITGIFAVLVWVFIIILLPLFLFGIMSGEWFISLTLIGSFSAPFLCGLIERWWQR